MRTRLTRLSGWLLDIHTDDSQLERRARLLATLVATFVVILALFAASWILTA